MKQNGLMTRRDSLCWLGCVTSAPGLLLGGCGGGGSSSPGEAPVSDSGGGATEQSFRHGDLITIEGAFGQSDVTHTFLGGASGMIEACQPGAEISNGNGWSVSYTHLTLPTSDLV